MSIFGFKRRKKEQPDYVQTVVDQLNSASPSHIVVLNAIKQLEERQDGETGFRMGSKAYTLKREDGTTILAAMREHAERPSAQPVIAFLRDRLASLHHEETEKDRQEALSGGWSRWLEKRPGHSASSHKR